MSNYKTNIARMVNEEGFDPYRETGKKCQYRNHRGDREAIIAVTVDNSCCSTAAEQDEYHTVRLCWRCAQYGYQDDFYCKCDSDENHHSANDLTFMGELHKV